MSRASTICLPSAPLPVPVVAARDGTAPRMLAVTIGVGKKWRKLAALAAESVRAQTGLETRILGDDTLARFRLTDPQHLKFRLFDACPDADDLLYFDADTIFLQRWDPRVFAGRGEFICVRDREDEENIRREAQLAALPASMYFNSGFFIAHRAHHARCCAKPSTTEPSPRGNPPVA